MSAHDTEAPPGMPFGLGYKVDPADASDFASDRLLGRPARAEMLVPASMMPYRVGILRQGAAGACVAFSLTRALDMALRYGANLAGIGHYDPPLASQRFLYFNARRQEALEAAARGQPPPVMHDGGSFPRLAMRAVQKLGFCEESLFPYCDRPQAIAEVPPASAYRAAYDQSGFRYYRVTSSGAARVAEVARALAMGHPVIFGMTVDPDFMLWTGDTPIAFVDTDDPHSGGHMLCVLEVTADRVITDNWWGQEWGADGLVHLTHELFGSRVVSDVYVIEAAPTFSQEDAA